MPATVDDPTTVLARLAADLPGRLVRPEDDDYDGARAVWNGMIDRRPAAVARCTSTEDVRLAVLAANQAALPLAVRGGGHSVAGLGTVDDGLVIDLTAMDEVVVDPATRLVRAGGGTTLGQLDAATQAHGLAVPTGVVTATGLAGLTLSGGMGWLRRRWGLTCDNLVGATVVTAAGDIVEVADDSEPDLLWALRGGGGNFGVVTEFVLTAHPLGPEVAFVLVFYPIDLAHHVLAEHERIVEEVGDGLSTIAVLGHVPATDDFPAEVHEQPFVGVLGVYAGPVAGGEAALRPLRELGEPLVDLSGPMPFLEVQQVFDADYPDGHRYYWKSTNVTALPADVIDILVAATLGAPSKETTIDLWLGGGAMATVDPAATAFHRRSHRYVVSPEANWQQPADDAANVAWCRELLAALEPYAAGGAYLNFPGFLEAGDDLVRASFGANYPRLQELKRRLDPGNLFRRNANIAPASDRPPAPRHRS